METWLVCFDVGDDRIRSRIGKRLLRHGERVQKSVFELVVRDRSEVETIRRQLLEIVEEETNIRFYRLCAACRSNSSTLEGGEVAHFPAVIIL